MSAPGTSGGDAPPAALASLMHMVQKAVTAAHLQRSARAAELYGRAVDVAVAAGAPPDSVVLCDLRLRDATAHVKQARAPGVARSEAERLCGAAWAAVRDVARTLTARARAGTLLPGGLREDELAYALAIAPVELRVHSPEHAGDAAFAADVTADAPLLGYQAALCAAVLTMGRVLPGEFALPPLARGCEEEAAALAFMLLVVGLIPAVRHDFRLMLAAEARFAFVMQQVCDPSRRSLTVAQHLTSAADFYDALTAAWVNPDVARTLLMRGTLDELIADEVEAGMRDDAARAAADAAFAGGLRHCALPSCGSREATVHQFKTCGGCRQLSYCSAAHAAEHWKSEHRRACSRATLPKAKAAP